jgi:hypothetical protein
MDMFPTLIVLTSVAQFRTTLRDEHGNSNKAATVVGRAYFTKTRQTVGKSARAAFT